MRLRIEKLREITKAQRREQLARTGLVMIACLWRSGQQTDEQLRAQVEEYQAAVAEYEHLMGVDNA